VKNILHLLRKELFQIRRDRAMLGVILVVPVVQILILAYAMTTDVRNLALVVSDLDKSTLSRELSERFCRTEYFTCRGHEENAQRLRRRLDRGQAVVALRFPPGFAAEVEAGRSPSLQLLVDGQNSNVGGIGLGYARQIVQDFLFERMQRPAAGRPRVALHWIEPVQRVFYNPELLSRHFMVPGILAMMLLIITMLLTSLALVKEREIGTLEQLMVTPIRKYELILGKVLPFMILALVMASIAGPFAILWFRVPFRGSLLTLLPMTLLYLFSTLGLGILISTISRTQQQALFVAWYFLVFLSMLSGFFFPIENMHPVFQYLTLLNPLRYFVGVVREVFLKGAGWTELWPQALALAVFGTGISSLAVWRFQKRVG
jgi:ABC-2 type transport system permease protein